MPQFDPSTFASQIFWLIISFGGLYWALTRFTLPKIAEILEARQSKIDDDLDRAVELERQAKDALATYEAAVEAAKAEAQSVVRQGVEEMAAVAQKRHGELAEKLAAQVAAAEARIAEDRTGIRANRPTRLAVLPPPQRAGVPRGLLSRGAIRCATGA